MKSSYLKPLLPLRDIVIFPSTVVPLFVGRKKSIKALEEVMKSDKSIVLVTQKNSETDDPTGKDLYQYGWFQTNSNDSYNKVKQKKPNPWGLYDMHGNVSAVSYTHLRAHET